MSCATDMVPTTMNAGIGGSVPVVAVVIPCYKVKRHILEVLAGIGAEVDRIYLVDDACPENSGRFVEELVSDNRIKVLYHPSNEGVGGAVITGYRAALADGADVIVKVDGDGQMDTRRVLDLVVPLIAGDADYSKGNRFFDVNDLREMPPIRIFGNAVLSLLAKLSTGYWNLFDPTNGFTAIHSSAARKIPFEKLSKRYFFETDMLFRLSLLRAVVIDIPMPARYGDEVSNLKISKIIGEFAIKHLRNFAKRIFYNYYLRDMSVASLELLLGIVMVSFGLIFGARSWYQAAYMSTETSSGTVMLAALPILMGTQFVLAFLSYDISAVPREPYCKKLSRSTDFLRNRRAKVADDDIAV